MHCNYPKFITIALAFSLTLALATLGQENDSSKKDKPAAGQPSESEMMAKMMELARPGENHKLLAQSAGTWTYINKMWMSPDPKAPPTEVPGTMVTRPIMGGRFFTSEHSGKVSMPGPDGKMTEMDFKGMALEGYDNVKKKFVATWIDNMGTGIMTMEGTYDAPTKTLTYEGEEEMMPGMKTKIRESLKLTDKDHHLFEWYEDRAGTWVKTMEINYTRKK